MYTSLMFKCENMFIRISFGKNSTFSTGLFEFLPSNVQILRRLKFSILQHTFVMFQTPEIEIRELNSVEGERGKMIMHKKLVEKINMLNKKICTRNYRESIGTFFP